MGKLTTHVLDTTLGKPGNAIAVSLFRIDGEQRQSMATVFTNDDGRCDQPLLEGDSFHASVYELVFAVGPYFAAQESNVSNDEASTAIRFLDDVVIRFGVSSPDQHYHVPLLITPYSYSTYRGS